MTLSLDHVSHRYVTHSGDVVHAVAETTLTISAGQFVCVVGPSGCGKTTLLNVLAGFVHPTGGAASVDGEAITGPSHQRGVVFQQSNLYPWLDVQGNVELGMKFRGVAARERRERAAEHLERVGLAHFAKSRPYELSGGMQQRAQIARVLAGDPDIILMDEPFGALDALTREQLQHELLAIARERRKTIFFITHSVDEAIVLGDRVLVMSPRPGRFVLDVPIEISAQHGRWLSGEELRATEEFREHRERIATAIVH